MSLAIAGPILIPTLAQPPNYYPGHFSNGPLWIEYLSQQLGFAYNQANNFAVGGSKTADVYQMASQFVPARDVSKALFVVWAGGNDILVEIPNGYNELNWNSQILSSVSNLSNTVVTLHARGAHNIMVPDTADITRFPLMVGTPAVQAAYIRSKIQLFNQKLAVTISSLQARFPDSKIFGCDIYSGMNLVLSHPSTYGFTKTNVAALGDTQLPNKLFGGPGANYVFWDQVHPTTKMHSLFAAAFGVSITPLLSAVSPAAAP